jgi:hypothetical protein
VRSMQATYRATGRSTPARCSICTLLVSLTAARPLTPDHLSAKSSVAYVPHLLL